MPAVRLRSGESDLARIPIRDLEQLEAALTEPPPGVVEVMSRMEGDLLLLGVGGKMGPSLARMARRASELGGKKRRIVGVARFTAGGLEETLHSQGIETLKCDLLDEQAVGELPDAPNLVYLAGMKFGSTGQEPLTWAMNTYLPALVCRRYPASRIVAFSTGNVYGLVPASKGGSLECDPLAPVGEYAMSCLGRERIFEHFSRSQGTLVSIIRLNYACDLRYGVLVDLAQKIMSKVPIDLSMGWFNTIWQGDANAMALQSFTHASSPPFVLNVTGPERLRVREVCERFGALLGRNPVFTGSEGTDALLNDAGRAFSLFGTPRVTADPLIEWVAAWLREGGATLNKLTHFESRDGKF